MGDWQSKARCKEIGPGLFFSTDSNDQEAARQICKGCEVQSECLRNVLSMHPSMTVGGIWAGLDEDELKAARRKTRRRALSF